MSFIRPAGIEVAMIYACEAFRLLKGYEGTFLTRQASEAYKDQQQPKCGGRSYARKVKVTNIWEHTSLKENKHLPAEDKMEYLFPSPCVQTICYRQLHQCQKAGFQRRLLWTSRIANAPLNKAPGRSITVTYRYEMEAWEAVLVYSK